MEKTVQGTVHQGSDIFSNQSRGRQCVGNAKMSSVYRHVSSKSLIDWNSGDVDYLLHKGDELYKHTYKFCNSTYLQPSELPCYICFEGQRVKCSIVKTYSGDISESFKDFGPFLSLESALVLETHTTYRNHYL